MPGERIEGVKGIRKLGPGRYEFRAFRNGAAISKTHDAKTDAEAKRLYRAWRVGVDEGRVRRAGETLNALMDDWLAHKAADLSPTTMELYRGLVRNHITPSALGRKPVNKVTTKDLDVFYAKLRASGVGPVTARKVHIVLHGAFRQGVTWDLLLTNPAERATAAKLPERRTEALTPSAGEVQKLVATAERGSPDFAVLLHLAAATGARRGELVALRWADVDLDNASLSVRRSLIVVKGLGVKGTILEKTPKSGKGRRVSLDPDTVAALRLHRSRCAERSLAAGAPLGKDAFVFSPRPGNTEPVHPDAVTERFGRLAKSAGVKVSFHGLRHFHCSQLIAAGEDVVTVGARVGHAKPSITTDIYAHAMPEKDRDAAALIGKIMSDARGSTN